MFSFRNAHITNNLIYFFAYAFEHLLLEKTAFQSASTVHQFD